MEKRVYLKELSVELDRRMNTIRGWEAPSKDGENVGEIPLPEPLRAHRDEKGWRFWTPAQVKRIKTWMKQTNRGPGVGLLNVDRSPERTQEVLEGLRQPRPNRRKDKKEDT